MVDIGQNIETTENPANFSAQPATGVTQERPAAPVFGNPSVPVFEGARPGIFSRLSTPEAGVQPVKTPEPNISGAQAETIKALRLEYAANTETFHALNHKNLDKGLEDNEKAQLLILTREAEAGLYNPLLSDMLLKRKSDDLKAILEAEARVISGPEEKQEMTDRYNKLCIKLADKGLIQEELFEYNNLARLAKQGIFELRKAA